jgi:SAM-dependent methyltransferase
MVDSFNGAWEEAGGEDYEVLPYPSMPFAYTQPERLAALAELFGLKAPDAREARVLELGCASGGNIIPLAARYPRARFLGIDLSQRHIEDGRKRIKALALANIELQQGDFAKLDFGSGQFDYLICHGVLSWVPKQAQDAIFRICKQALVANGVAAISYNVLPGWHLRTIVRDICIHHVGRDGSPRARVANARKALELIAGALTEKNAYGVLLRDEARRIAGRPAAYIMGEFLAAENSPCYFHEFVERAKRFNLAFLCEGDLNASIPEIQEPELRRRNRALAGSDYLALEQYIDFFTGRTFRRSILVKAEQSRQIRRNRNFERLQSLHFASAAGRSLASGGDLAAAKLDRLTFKKAVADATLCGLSNAYPGTLSMPELVAAVETSVPKADGEAIARAVLHLVVAGQATASTLPASAGRASVGQVRVWSLARLEAAAKQPWVTSLNHLPVPLQRLPVALLSYLDGSRDGEALRPLIVRALLDGAIEIGGGVSGRKPAELRSAADHYLQRALEQLQGQALLEP